MKFPAPTQSAKNRVFRQQFHKGVKVKNHQGGRRAGDWLFLTSTNVRPYRTSTSIGGGFPLMSRHSLPAKADSPPNRARTDKFTTKNPPLRLRFIYNQLSESRL